MAKKFTEEEKKAVLARASEIGVKEAAKESGVSFQTVYKWNKKAAVNEKTNNTQVAAITAEIEVKEKAAKTSRKMKEKVKNAKGRVFSGSIGTHGEKGYFAVPVFQYKIWREEDTLHASCYIRKPDGEIIGQDEMECELSRENADAVKNWQEEQIKKNPDILIIS